MALQPCLPVTILLLPSALSLHEPKQCAPRIDWRKQLFSLYPEHCPMERRRAPCMAASSVDYTVSYYHSFLGRDMYLLPVVTKLPLSYPPQTDAISTPLCQLRSLYAQPETRRTGLWTLASTACFFASGHTCRPSYYLLHYLFLPIAVCMPYACRRTVQQGLGCLLWTGRKDRPYVCL